MRLPVRRPGALLLALLLAGPPAGNPQESSSFAGLAGNWEGGARLTNDWPGHPCRYDTPEDVPGAAGEPRGSGEPTGVRLALELVEGSLRGSVAIDIPAAEGSGCPPLRKRHLVTEVVLGAGVVSLTDSGGHHWDLALRRDGRVLRGMMSWQQGGAEESLAQGFSFPDGTRPGSRLSGEVNLRKAVPPPDETAGTGGAESAGGASTAPQTTSAGTHFKNVGIVLGATAVGLAGLYGVNQLGQGSSEGGSITCSPRECVVGAPNEPCFCEGNVVSGNPCGETETGVEIGGECSLPSRPCQATLSCNSGFCEDRFGRCPFN
jgi:hypothetical protein